MANEQNLRPVRSEKEARELGRKGGIASGKARKEKATMRKTLEMLLDSKSPDGKTYRELSTLGLLKGSIEGKAENYKTILQVLGEITENQNLDTPTVKIELVDNSNLEKSLVEENEKD